MKKTEKLSGAASEISLCWEKAIYIYDCGTNLTCNFDITPTQFLTFAKKDIKLQDNRGRINALSNSKRAIDCSIDKFFFATGLENSNKDSLNKYLDMPHFRGHLPEATMKLKVIHALGLAPIRLVSKYRRLRNLLEHEYRLPTNEDVEDALELAEMFVNSIEYSLSVFTYGFNIKDNTQEASIRVWFDNKRFEIKVWKKGNYETIVEPIDLEFLPLIRVAVSLGKDHGIEEAHRDLCVAMDVPYTDSTHNPSIE